MRATLVLWTLSTLIYSQISNSGCTLSNRVEDTKVLCSIKDVNPNIEYVRLLTPGLALLSAEQRARTAAEFIHRDGRTEALTLTPTGCLSLPKADGQLSVRVSSNEDWVAFENDLKATRVPTQRDLPLAARGRLNMHWPCPDQGLLANNALTTTLTLKENAGNLQNLQLQMNVSDKSGRNLGTLFTKEFGRKDLELPTSLTVEALPEGEYNVSISLHDSFFGKSPKALLVASQCPLHIKRSCTSPNDTYDAVNVSCKPKLCDNKHRIGEFWSEDLANRKGTGLFTCQLKAGEAVKVGSDATCQAGYFEARASCLGATQVAAGLNHSCAVLENGDVSCWGYNVFDTLGTNDKLGGSGQVLGPQAPVLLSEAAQYVAVGSVSSCALLTSGRVQCWGLLPQTVDAHGIVQYAAQSQPKFVQKADGSELHQVVSLVVGGGPDHDTYCVVNQNKEDLCWGKDLLNHRQAAQFGHWLYPKRVFPERKVQQLAVSDREICTLDGEGAVWCQGSALGEDLAAITADSLATPLPVTLPAAALWISSQSVGKCARLVDGRLFCWGLKTDRVQNLEWNFAHGVPDIPRAMTLPEENTTFSQFAKEAGLNGEISCILKTDRQPVCQLGPNAYEFETVNGVSINTRPTRLEVRDILKSDNTVLRDIKTMGVGFWHGCGVHESGRVYCWGNNQFGRLGNGTIGQSGTGTGIPQNIQATLIQAP